MLELTSSVVLEVAHIFLDLVIEVQERVPLVQGNALVGGGLQELQKVRQVRRAVIVEHNRQQADDDLLFCNEYEVKDVNYASIEH